MSLWLERFNELQRYVSMLQEADQYRLSQQIRHEKNAQPALWKAMAWLGIHLSSAGNWLEHRYGSAANSTAPAGKRSIV